MEAYTGCLVWRLRTCLVQARDPRRSLSCACGLAVQLPGSIQTVLQFPSPLLGNHGISVPIFFYSYIFSILCSKKGSSFWWHDILKLLDSFKGMSMVNRGMDLRLFSMDSARYPNPSTPGKFQTRPSPAPQGGRNLIFNPEFVSLYVTSSSQFF